MLSIFAIQIHLSQALYVLFDVQSQPFPPTYLFAGAGCILSVSGLSARLSMLDDDTHILIAMISPQIQGDA